MDRREALKKLAVGGAIAAGGSLVLSSNAVAATSSGIDLTGIPQEGENLAGFSIGLMNNDRQLTISAPQPPAGVVATYGWNVQSFDVKQKNVIAIEVTSGGRTFTQSSCNSGCSYFAGDRTAVAETVFKNPNPKDPKKFKTNDTVTLGLAVTWTLPDGRTISADFVVTVVVGRTVEARMMPDSYVGL